MNKIEEFIKLVKGNPYAEDIERTEWFNRLMCNPTRENVLNGFEGHISKGKVCELLDMGMHELYEILYGKVEE